MVKTLLSLPWLPANTHIQHKGQSQYMVENPIRIAIHFSHKIATRIIFGATIGNSGWCGCAIFFASDQSLMTFSGVWWFFTEILFFIIATLVFFHTGLLAIVRAYREAAILHKPLSTDWLRCLLRHYKTFLY